ncbi:NHL repeat-containing protein [Dinghuibacter silviterrae]|uniref:Sugar lactone lactonase YvrE n=1 Tax=Dinghuibacter silviterrae TaxID=1539049 RepID=A0A4R8DSQ8_9BACT|nr:NHL repeat-containing protein [Dinghuibacter silviterrae]TDX00906.1 sugar lactone lactonase YvrE [Dinghuibacter silviterrae]
MTLRKTQFVLSLAACALSFSCKKSGSSALTESNSYVVSTLAGGTTGLANGTGTAAKFDNPLGVAVDNSGNVYVADYFNCEIRKVTPAGVVTTFAGSGSPGAADGNDTAASFNGPVGIAIDQQGNLYVSDQNNHKIRKITPAGVVSTLAGNGKAASVDGADTAASFIQPDGIGVDGSGNVYVADRKGFKIRKITPAGLVTTFAGSGSSGSAGGTGTAASFDLPTGLCVDGSGNVYVTDDGDYLIRKITPAGAVSTLAGNIGVSDTTDGMGTAATFGLPYMIAADRNGYLYVTDASNATVRKVSPAGLVTTIAGSNENQGTTDGPGNIALFQSPSGVAVDGNGDVYVSDLVNANIRKLTQQ